MVLDEHDICPFECKNIQHGSLNIRRNRSTKPCDMIDAALTSGTQTLKCQKDQVFNKSFLQEQSVPRGPVTKECRSLLGNRPAQSVDRICCLKFVAVFLSRFKQIPGIWLQRNNECFSVRTSYPTVRFHRPVVWTGCLKYTTSNVPVHFSGYYLNPPALIYQNSTFCPHSVYYIPYGSHNKQRLFP
jgi:hypothetical protein